MVHTRIQPSKNGGFFVKIGATTFRGPSLRELMASIEQKGIPEFKTVLLGHPFANIFTIKKGGKYAPIDNEEEEDDEPAEPEPVKTPKGSSSGGKKSSSRSEKTDKKKSKSSSSSSRKAVKKEGK
jgi:hypothetical protein